jgi:hypothetical protein
MLVERTSILSGKTRTMELNITQEQMENWVKGMHIQHAFSNLSADEREFIKTGISAEEWLETFGEEN